MKPTNEQIKTISNALSKKHQMDEGIIGYIFGETLQRQLKKDKKLNSIVNDLDSSLSKIKKEVERMKKAGEPIPPSYERLLKFKAQ